MNVEKIIKHIIVKDYIYYIPINIYIFTDSIYNSQSVLLHNIKKWKY